jgi:hypothetical protein
MTGKHANLTEWPSVPADRDLPPGRHDLHRETLMNHIRGQRPPAAGRPLAARTGWHSRRRQLAAAIASLAIVAGVVAGVVGSSVSAGGAPPRARHATPSDAATLAAKVLRDAATHVARETVPAEASPGQWIYTKAIDTGYNSGSMTDSFWVTFDGSQNAYYSQGQLVVHTSDLHPPGPDVPAWKAWDQAVSGMTACNVLASLPDDSQQLLAAIAAHMGTTPDTRGDDILPDSPPPVTRAQTEFAYLTHIMWNTFLGAGCPPAVLGAPYRALATLPGISVQTGISDAAGAPAIGISDDGGYGELLLSPTSYQVIGLRVTSTGVNPLVQRLGQRIDTLSGARRAAAVRLLRTLRRLYARWPAKGEVVTSTALVRAVEVAAAGDV